MKNKFYYLLPKDYNNPKNYKNDPIVYVCENYTCKLPTSELEKVIQLLSDD